MSLPLGTGVASQPSPGDEGFPWAQIKARMKTLRPHFPPVVSAFRALGHREVQGQSSIVKDTFVALHRETEWRSRTGDGERKRYLLHSADPFSCLQTVLNKYVASATKANVHARVAAAPSKLRKTCHDATLLLRKGPDGCAGATWAPRGCHVGATRAKAALCCPSAALAILPWC